MTKKPLNLDTFKNPHMREVARWHNLIVFTDSVTEQTGFGLADVWGLIKAGAYNHAQARLYKHVMRLRQLNAVGNRGDGDPESRWTDEDEAGNRRSNDLCSECARELNLDPSSPESPRSGVSVGKESP